VTSADPASATSRTAPDSAVLTALVRAGLGAGLTVAQMPADAPPPGLVHVALPELPQGIVHVGLRRDVRPRAYVHDFVTSYAPHLTRELVIEALAARDSAAIAALVATSAPAAMI
jgi:LysR family transcriptional regulator, cys regulon transcriptional activator